LPDRRKAHQIEWVEAENAGYYVKRCKVCRATFAMSPWPDQDKTLGDDCPGEPEAESG